MKKWGMRIVFIVGFLLCCFPFISNIIEQHQNEKTIATYNKEAAQLEDKISEMISQAQDYNSRLFQSQGGILESTDLLSDEIYYSQLDLTGTGIMGSLEIPKISVNLPIYHGTDKEVLAEGVGHLQGTSLPVGGNNTHSALSGHRGLPSAKLLVRLDEMEEGDYFFVKVGEENMAYKVCEIQVVEPDDTSKLEIVAGKDLVSLITCTPYGLNTHRLIVTGTRVEYEETTYESIETAIPSAREIIMTVLPFVFIILVLVLYMILYMSDRKQWKDNDGKI